jgi:hypothetical protein
LTKAVISSGFGAPFEAGAPASAGRRAAARDAGRDLPAGNLSPAMRAANCARAGLQQRQPCVGTGNPSVGAQTNIAKLQQSDNRSFHEWLLRHAIFSPDKARSMTDR